MRLLCSLGIRIFSSYVDQSCSLVLAKRTFLDMRVARIHYTKGRMRSLPITRRSIEILKCNISRLRDLKEIHQEIGHDLLLPNDQLYLALDLLVTDFDLLNCELDAQVEDNRTTKRILIDIFQVKFADAMVLQTIIKGLCEFPEVIIEGKIIIRYLSAISNCFDLDLSSGETSCLPSG